jgi:hypothetical protein
MPQVTVTDSKGLVQSAGSGVVINSNVSFGGTSTLSGQKSSVSLCDSGQTLTAADSGKVFLLMQAVGARTVTLPSVSTGMTFRFILDTAAAGNWSIVQASATQDFYGSIVAADGGAGDTAITTDTLVRFVGGTAVAGDQLELVCSDSKWFIRGHCSVAGGIVFA